MVPSKPEDFTGPHGSFEGQEECRLNLTTGHTIKVYDENFNLILCYSATASGWLRWTANPANGISR